jgi:hypothetical protein
MPQQHDAACNLSTPEAVPNSQKPTASELHIHAISFSS